MEEKVISFLKGLMQPAITIVALIIILFILIYGKTGAPYDQLFWLACGVVGFWFGKTIGLFGDAKTATTTNADTTTKLTEIVANLQEQSAIQGQDLATSVPVAVVKDLVSKVNAPTVTATTTSGADPDPEAYLKEIS
jgi:hypothetical protein